MRIRTAHVALHSDEQSTQDLETIFDRAVERRHAWLTGCGDASEELIDIAREHGYRAAVAESQDEGETVAINCWIAVRGDLFVEDTWEQGIDENGLVCVLFETTYPGLGTVCIGTDIERPNGDILIVTWSELEMWESIGKLSVQDGRVERLTSEKVAVNFHAEHFYGEALFAVNPL